MARITVLGGTGYAGAAIVAEAAARGHEVTAFSRTRPSDPLPAVRYVEGEATDEAALASVIGGAEVVVAALSPRGALAERFREVYRTAGRLADAAHARLLVVGGYSSLRPAEGADRFVSDLSDIPERTHPEILAGAALILEDLPATPHSLDWTFISPPLGFGSWVPGEQRGRYRIGGEVALQPDDGGAISAADYALGVLDLVEQPAHRREHVNLAH